MTERSADATPRRGRISPLFTWRGCISSGGGPVDHVLDVVSETDPDATTTVKGPTQRHVALALSLHMNERGGSCYPGVARIARESGLGQRTVQKALRALEITGWLEIQLADSPDGTNLYRATIPDGYADPDDEQGGAPGAGGNKTTGGAHPVRGAHPGRRGGAPGAPKDVIEDVIEELSPTERVSFAWIEHAPPLMRHREKFLRTSRTQAAIKAALKVYEVEDVVTAIGHYATVLGSDDYRWTYAWTIIDFLNRGLDRFVDEAQPLLNYRVRHGGQAGASADDFAHMPDFDE